MNRFYFWLALLTWMAGPVYGQSPDSVSADAAETYMQRSELLILVQDVSMATKESFVSDMLRSTESDPHGSPRADSSARLERTTKRDCLRTTINDAFRLDSVTAATINAITHLAPADSMAMLVEWLNAPLGQAVTSANREASAAAMQSLMPDSSHSQPTDRELSEVETKLLVEIAPGTRIIDAILGGFKGFVRGANAVSKRMTSQDLQYMLNGMRHAMDADCRVYEVVYVQRLSDALSNEEAAEYLAFLRTPHGQLHTRLLQESLLGSQRSVAEGIGKTYAQIGLWQEIRPDPVE